MGNYLNKTLKQQYFSIVSSSMKQAYIENSTSPFNQAISLLKKDFDTPITNQRVLINNSVDPLINWQSYLQCYLQEEIRNQTEWAEELYEFVIKQSFANQVQFQSNFFYEEYYIMTCPKLIKNSAMSNKDYLINTSAHNINSNSEDYNGKMNLSNNFMASFISFSSFQSNDSVNFDKVSKAKIVEYLKIFKSHLFHDNHPLYIIVKKFDKLFGKVVQDTLNHLKSEKNNPNYQTLIETERNEIVQQLKTFIIEMQVIVKMFYSSSISFGFFKDEKDEFINLVTSLVFNVGNLYDLLYQLFHIELNEKIIIFEQKLNLLKNCTPQDLSIKDKFCLNELTKEYQSKLIEKARKKKVIQPKENADQNLENFGPNNNPKEIKLDEKEDFQLKEKDNANLNKVDSTIDVVDTSKHDNSNPEMIVSSESNKLLQFTRSSINLSDDNINSNQPYDKAIKLLQSIVDYKVPLEKLIIIASVSAEITVCVNDFWQKMRSIVTPSLLNIDADELMTIYIYIIIHSQLSEIFIHSAFVKYFTTAQTKSTMMGYYFSTLEGSLDYLLGINDLNDFSSTDKKNSAKAEEVQQVETNDVIHSDEVNSPQ